MDYELIACNGRTVQYQLRDRRIEYGAAVELLQAEIAKDPSKWAYPDVSFGTDLQTEHER
jgi:aspartyl/asparaginyl-tRNA synthetase